MNDLTFHDRALLVAMGSILQAQLERNGTVDSHGIATKSLVMADELCKIQNGGDYQDFKEYRRID